MDDTSERLNGSSTGSRSAPSGNRPDHTTPLLRIGTVDPLSGCGSTTNQRPTEHASRGLSVTARAALALLRPLFDRSSAGWFVYAGDGRLIYANAALERTLTTKVTIGSTLPVPMVVSESRIAYQKVLRRLRADPMAGATVMTLRVPVGDECRLMSVSLLPAPDTGSNGQSVIGMLQDVTVTAEAGRDAALERLGQLENVIARIGADLEALTPPSEPRLPAVEGLSPRQKEIFQRLAVGERPATIARYLHLSVHTVRNHMRAIFRVFGVHSQSELLVRIRSHARPNG